MGFKILALLRASKDKILDQRRVLKNWENYITELSDRTYRPKNPEVESDNEEDTDEINPWILHSAVE